MSSSGTSHYVNVVGRDHKYKGLYLWARPTTFFFVLADGGSRASELYLEPTLFRLPSLTSGGSIEVRYGNTFLDWK